MYFILFFFVRPACLLPFPNTFAARSSNSLRNAIRFVQRLKVRFSDASIPPHRSGEIANENSGLI
jgi:hypothetical protein